MFFSNFKKFEQKISEKCPSHDIERLFDKVGPPFSVSLGARGHDPIGAKTPVWFFFGAKNGSKNFLFCFAYDFPESNSFLLTFSCQMAMDFLSWIIYFDDRHQHLDNVNTDSFKNEVLVPSKIPCTGAQETLIFPVALLRLFQEVMRFF